MFKKPLSLRIVERLVARLRKAREQEIILMKTITDLNLSIANLQAALATAQANVAALQAGPDLTTQVAAVDAATATLATLGAPVAIPTPTPAVTA